MATTDASNIEGTQLTINHNIAADLDSTNAFEGPEKLLEVWFASSPGTLAPGVKANGLKEVSSAVWEDMLDLVNCKVLSFVSSDHVDAYLLSESSMFVFAHKIILKTCGTTTLLLGLHRLLRIAATEAGFPFHNADALNEEGAAAIPYRVFYSRKNFLFPDRQYGPHRSWKQEVDFLDDMFEDGSAYMVGKMNGDHWYLYMTAPNAVLTPECTSTGETKTRIRSSRFLSSPGSSIILNDANTRDETLEILMTDLDKDKAKQFYLKHASFGDGTRTGDNGSSTEGHALGTLVTDCCGLSEVYPRAAYPDARIDAYLFSPCGFSANGVVPAGAGLADHYFTVHVTPEPNCSYASFETNVPGGQRGRDTADVIEQVVGIFRPGRFSITLFEAKGTGARKGEMLARKPRPDLIRGYRRVDRIAYDFEDYDLVFGYYEREGWESDGVARVGEDIW